LGVDLILSDRRDAPARWTVCIGPVLLSRYYEFQQPNAQRQLQSVLELTLPMYQEYDVSWTVLDPGAPIQLGSAEGNGVLGVNSHFGAMHARGVAIGVPHE
jgi:hypothetical protein